MASERAVRVGSNPICFYAENDWDGDAKAPSMSFQTLFVLASKEALRVTSRS